MSDHHIEETNRILEKSARGEPLTIDERFLFLQFVEHQRREREKLFAGLSPYRV